MRRYIFFTSKGNIGIQDTVMLSVIMNLRIIFNAYILYGFLSVSCSMDLWMSTYSMSAPAPSAVSRLAH